MKRTIGLAFRLLTCLVFILLIGASAFAGYRVYAAWRLQNRGLVTSLKAPLAPLHDPRYAVNVALEQYPDEAALRTALAHIKTAGLQVVRQEFSWASIEPSQGTLLWDNWDTIMRLCREYGIRVIAVLDTSPAWARNSWELDNKWAPPADYQEYARFAGLLAARYAGQIEAYQIWDKPNISPNWGNGEIDPQGYVEFLRLASSSIRAADPHALIITGGMAPTIEQTGKNLSDIQFLREISRRGASQYYDILGIRALGFWSGPDDRQANENVLNFSRAILFHEELAKRGDSLKAIWVLDSGWCALPANWQGEPSPSGNDNEALQAARLTQALHRLEREWPWLSLFTFQPLQPNAGPTDPVWGYSLITPDGRPREFYKAIQSLLQRPPVAYPGLEDMPEAYLFIVSPNQSTLRFYGSDLALQFSMVSAETSLAMQLDAGVPFTVSLHAEPGSEWQRVANNLAIGEHTLYLSGTPTVIATITAFNVRARPNVLPHLWPITAASLAIIYLAIVLVRTARRLPGRTWWALLLAHLQNIPAWLSLAVLSCLFAVTAFAPFAMVRLAALALYALSALTRPRQVLWIALFCVPLAPIQVRLGPGSFSIAEVSLLAAVGAYAWQLLFSTKHKVEFNQLIGSIRLIDAAVLLLFLAGLLASTAAEYQRVAWREFRVVIFDSILFYLLIRTQKWDTRGLRLIQTVLVLSAVGVAVYALIAYLTPNGVVVAEGVRRARAYFGSPNNLALYLERLLPAALVLGLTAVRLRRWLYFAGAGLILLVIILTFSRGALLLGLPAAGLVLFIAMRGKRRWLVLAGIMLILLALLPVLGLERFNSLLDPSRGTTFIRLGLWRASILMVRDHPILGVGPDNFLYYYGDYIQPGAEVERYLSHPHNFILDFWLRLGIGGLLVLLAFAWGIVKEMLRIKRLPPEPATRLLMVGCLAGVAAMFVHGLIDQSYFVIELAYWFMITMAWMTLAVNAKPNLKL
ncbi:MAG: O-antigen ligase family protein [Anaerolineae bacterium]